MQNEKENMLCMNLLDEFLSLTNILPENAECGSECNFFFFLILSKKARSAIHGIIACESDSQKNLKSIDCMIINGLWPNIAR